MHIKAPLIFEAFVTITSETLTYAVAVAIILLIRTFTPLILTMLVLTRSPKFAAASLFLNPFKHPKF